MHVDEQNSTIQVDFERRTFHFCSKECKEVFQTNPAHTQTQSPDAAALTP